MADLFVLSVPLTLVGMGVFYWLADVGEARKTEAEAAADNAAARLLEAALAAKAAPLPDTDTGGKGAA